MKFSQRKTAKEYYSDPLLSNLLNAVFKKYRGQNGVRGNASIKVISIDEAKRLENYFANRIQNLIRPGTELKIPLIYFDEELNLGYGLTIPDLYEVLYDEPLLTKTEQRELKEVRWYSLFGEVSRKFKEKIGVPIENKEFSKKTFWWYERLKEGKAPGYRSLSYSLNKGDKAVDILLNCMEALWYLLMEKNVLLERVSGEENTGCVEIPVFASEITSDPHEFDRSNPSGILLLNALDEIYSQKQKMDDIRDRNALVIPDFMRRRQIFRSFGLYDDDISSFVHLFAPPYIENSAPRTINLREVTEYKKIPYYSEIYIFENPSVFSFLVREVIYFLDINRISLEDIADFFPALVCTSGRARNAALLFINECLKVNLKCKVYYSGDLDVPGVQMLKEMQNQFPENVEALKMDVKSYVEKANYNNLPLSDVDCKVLSKMSSDLEKIMAQYGVKVYQEIYTKELKNELISIIKNNIKIKGCVNWMEEGIE